MAAVRVLPGSFASFGGALCRVETDSVTEGSDGGDRFVSRKALGGTHLQDGFPMARYDDGNASLNLSCEAREVGLYLRD